MNNKMVVLIGPYSSVGGVSEHIKRLKNLLEDKYDVKIIDESKLIETKTGVFNIRRGNVLKYFSLIIRSDIVHIHSGTWWLRLVHIIASKVLFKKTVVTVHSLTNIRGCGAIFLTNLTLRLNNHTICVNEIIYKTLRFSKKSKYSIIPAFIPPPITDDNLPQTLLNEIFVSSEPKIIVANAYRIILKGNIDLYGIDLALKVAEQLKISKINYKIIFVIASLIENKNLYTEYREYIDKNELNKYIFLYPEAINFAALIKMSDLVLRPTSSDGDALTIREALYFNKPVIASDVINRPLGTVLFKNRDAKDLFNKIKDVLSVNNKFESQLPQTDYQNIYLKIYNS